MEVIKKYTAIILGTKTINDTVKVKLSYGNIEGPYYNTTEPEEEFDTEEEAIEYAFKKNKHTRWLILPVIRFDTMEHHG
jgi:hypothetical protein